MKNQKHLSLFLILLIGLNAIAVNASNASNNSKNLNKSKIATNINLHFGNTNSKSKIGTFATSKQDEEKKGIKYDVNEGFAPIWKGWVKYFYYEQDKKFVGPNDFFVNNFFFKQHILNTRLTAKGTLPGEKKTPENNMYYNIPSRFHFFATLTPHYLEINGDRKNLLTSKLELLDVDLIDPYLKIDMERTGLKELGEFKEGRCFDISAHKMKSYMPEFYPEHRNYRDSKGVHWIICMDLDDENKYKSLFDNLVSLLDNRELNREKDKVVVDDVEFEGEKNTGIERYNGFDAKPDLDGYLRMINDWTQCTMRCGGGFSYQQWQCIPPKQGGKPCMGELIRKKKCNEKPCPSIGKYKTEVGSNNLTEEIIEKPIVKTQVISNRLQQNVDCVIREEDVLQTYLDENNQKMSLPSRLVLNQKSITLFTDLLEKKTLFAFDINNAQLNPITGQDCCFKVTNENKQFKICGMSKCKTFRDSWFKSVDLFRSKCYNIHVNEPEDPFKKTPPEAPGEGEGFGVNMDMSEDMANAKKEGISAKLAKRFQAESTEGVGKAEKDALTVINREIDIEDLIKKEEMMKNKEKVKMKLDEFKKEEMKKKKLEEALDSTNENQDALVKTLKVKQDITEIKNKTADEVEKRRNSLKKKIAKIRKLAERRSKIIQNKINIVRNEMSQKILMATKTGDADKCRNNLGKQAKMDQYCNDYYLDDLIKNTECKVKENFCFSCCNSEFGGTNSLGLEKCINYCLAGEASAGTWEKKAAK